ncbi:MAG TPA: ATP-binding cassette domain-containing protein [Marinobacter sp.]|nr:ATP-binding cassette domain-containing protein [Marinobacter sp.]
MTEPLLTVRGLGKHFASAGQTVSVLSGLELTLARGESLALMGRSGSGKSTLLNILCGLEQPDAGVVSIVGEHFSADSSTNQQRWARLRRQRIGVVFQEANLMPALSLLDNVRLRARLAGQSDQQCGEWLKRLGIGELAQRYPDQVSGGQRQRAALAMVFAMPPLLILADEPTGSLDARTALEVTDELFHQQAASGCALVLATHDSALAARCGQRLDLAQMGA